MIGRFTMRIANVAVAAALLSGVGASALRVRVPEATPPAASTQLLSSDHSDSVIVITGARAADTKTGRFNTTTLLIRDGKIAARGASIVTPSGARVIDLHGMTLIPGMIDTHVHLTLAGRPRDNAKKTLEAGFTTVADLGSANGAGVRIRKLIDADSIPGPRVIAAGSWIGGRGGVCEFGGATIRGADEAGKRATADVAAGADLLKLCVTDWLDPSVQFPDSVELTADEINAVRAVGSTSHKPLVAHSINRAGVRASLAGGVRWFAHTPVVDAKLAKEIAQSGACVSTTMTTLSQGTAANELRTSFRELRKANVKLMLGTDAGVLAHGSNADELVSLATSGMTALEALGAATWVAADCLGLHGYGRLDAGSPADIVGVAGDPLSNIALLKTPSFVMRKGVVVKHQ